MQTNLFYSILKRFEHQITRRNVLIGGILVTILLIVFSKFKPLFFTNFLIALGSVSMIYQRYFRKAYYIGFELCMMATVLTGLQYGVFYGATSGFLSILFAFIISGNFKPTYFISVLVLPLIAFILPLFDNVSLPLIGIICTIIYDAIILPLYIVLGNSKVWSSAIFFVTHVLLNAWVFSSIAPLIAGFM